MSVPPGSKARAGSGLFFSYVEFYVLIDGKKS
jgi:hypothetical protein